MSTTIKRVDGQNFLYEYLQHDLRTSDPVLFRCIVRDMIIKLGIWLPRSMYQSLPILLPHVVRDASCRANKRLKRDEQWGSANSQGFLRDDNSLIKGLVRSLDIKSPNYRPYNNRRRGGGFWAAHVWDRTVDDQSATEDARTNSFVPNLVWLPASVAQLTDTSKSYAQWLVQALAQRLYRDVQLHVGLSPFVSDAWNQLLNENCFVSEQLPDPKELNFFELSPRFLDTRLRRIEASLSWLTWVGNGKSPTSRPSIPGRILPSRYGDSLKDLDPARAVHLSGHLERYLKAAKAAMYERSQVL